MCIILALCNIYAFLFLNNIGLDVLAYLLNACIGITRTLVVPQNLASEFCSPGQSVSYLEVICLRCR